MAHLAIALLKGGARRALLPHAALGVAHHAIGRKLAGRAYKSVRSGSQVLDATVEGDSMARHRRRKGHRKAHRTPKQKAAARRNLKKARAALRRKRRRHH